MSTQAEQFQQFVLRSREILFASLVEELNRAITCCLIGKSTTDTCERLRYLLIGEATSARLRKLRLQRKIGESKSLLGLMSILEQELGGHLYNDWVTGNQLGARTSQATLPKMLTRNPATTPQRRHLFSRQRSLSLGAPSTGSLSNSPRQRAHEEWLFSSS
jgi:hypothetical protein